MQIHNVEQNTPEWFLLRKFKLTASNAQAIASNGKGLNTLCLELVAGGLSKAAQENYTNDNMQRGINLEAEARIVYEFETGSQVKQVGFITLDEYTGCSPDGLIGEDGLIEIKCKNDKNHFLQLVEGESGIESSYIWQMQMQMYVTGRKWCDFVCYNPNFDKNFLCYRINRDEDKIKKIIEGIENGKKLIKELLIKAGE